MKTKTIEKNHARDQAACQLESIREMVKTLNDAAVSDAAGIYDDAETVIQEDALSVEVRSGWHTVGTEEPQSDAEYNILLCTGGPAVRIIGTLDGGQPETASLEYLDWGTPWTEYRLTADEERDVLRYASCFYYGE